MSSPAYGVPRLPERPEPWANPTAPPGAHVRSGPGRPLRREPVREAPRSVVLRLTGTKEECAQTRDFTHRALLYWALGHVSDDALTVVTELTANAVVHALPQVRPDEAEMWLRLSLRPAHLLCAVTDQSNGLPVLSRASDPLQEHGRGLRIVDALSEHWGWTRRSPRGKTVWAMLPVQPRP